MPPASSGRSRYQSIGFVVFLVVVIGVGVGVGQAAQDAILESQAGSISEYSLDPTQPGFRAFTTATPTALVMHTTVVPGEGASLLGVTLLASGSDSSGGAVVTIPATFVDPENSARTLAELFQSDGLTAVTSELRSSLRIDFSDLVVLDAASWTTLMAEDLPLQFTLRENLVREFDTGTILLLEAGTRPFNLTDVALLASHRNPDEPSLRVALRQQQIWQSWISRTAGSDSRPELFAIGEGFVQLLDSLANGEVAYRTLPTLTRASQDEADTRYEPNRDAIAGLLSVAIPFPEVADVAERPAVLLLDTSAGEVDQRPVVSSIVRAGGHVTIIGNANEGAERRAEVQLHNRSAGQVAQAIADALDVADPTVVEVDDAATAITVIVG